MSETIDNIVGKHVTNWGVSGLTCNSRFEIYSIGAPKPPRAVDCSPITTNPMGGLLDSQPFQTGYNIPGENTQLHLHGPDKNTITQGHILDLNRNVLKDLTGYDAAIAVSLLDNLSVKKFP